MKFEDAHAAVAVSSAHGIYIGQVFAQIYKEALRKNGYNNEDLQILLAGPDHEDYLQTWADNLFPITLKDDDGKEFVFDTMGEDGDIWELSKEEFKKIEWED